MSARTKLVVAALALAIGGAAGCKKSEPPAPPPVDPARCPRSPR